MLRRWLRRWLGVDDAAERIGSVAMRLYNVERERDRLQKAASDAVAVAVRVKAAEASCRLLERRVWLLEAFKPADLMSPLGVAATAQDAARAAADRDRLERSAAEARGQAIEEYRDSLALRRWSKANPLPGVPPDVYVAEFADDEKPEGEP